MASSLPSASGQQNQDEEWVFVKKRKGARGKRRVDIKSELKETFVPRSTNLRSPEELEADYRKIRSQWEASSSSYQQLRDVVAANAASAQPITKAVCLGIGTMDPEDGGWQAKRRTYIQFIAFLVMVEEIEAITGTKIKCFFQEPILTDSEKAFISSLGHAVVESPEGCDMVDADTLFFGVHLYRPVYVMALKNHLPAVFVGTGWDVWDGVTMEKHNDLANLEKMEHTHKKCAFPQDDESTAFSSTSVYWRRSASKDAAVEETDNVESSRKEQAIDGVAEKAEETRTH